MNFYWKANYQTLSGMLAQDCFTIYGFSSTPDPGNHLDCLSFVNIRLSRYPIPILDIFVWLSIGDPEGFTVSKDTNF